MRQEFLGHSLAAGTLLCESLSIHVYVIVIAQRTSQYHFRHSRHLQQKLHGTQVCEQKRERERERETETDMGEPEWDQQMLYMICN